MTTKPREYWSAGEGFEVELLCGRPDKSCVNCVAELKETTDTKKFSTNIHSGIKEGVVHFQVPIPIFRRRDENALLKNQASRLFEAATAKYPQCRVAIALDSHQMSWTVDALLWNLVPTLRDFCQNNTEGKKQKIVLILSTTNPKTRVNVKSVLCDRMGTPKTNTAQQTIDGSQNDNKRKTGINVSHTETTSSSSISSLSRSDNAALQQTHDPHTSEIDTTPAGQWEAQAEGKVSAKGTKSSYASDSKIPIASRESTEIISAKASKTIGSQRHISGSTCTHIKPTGTVLTEIPIDYTESYSKDKECIVESMKLTGRSKADSDSTDERKTIPTKSMSDSRISIDETTVSVSGSQAQLASGESKYLVPASGTAALVPRQRLKVEIKPASMENIKADVLVCVVNGELNLSDGTVSRALDRKEQSKLQKQLNKCQTLGPKGIAVLNGMELECKHVFCAMLEPQSKAPHEKYRSENELCKVNVKDFVQRCLEKAENLKCKTMAFPVIGSKTLKYPVEIVARYMLYAISGFNNQHCSCLTTVIIAIHPEDQGIMKVFQREGERFQGMLEMDFQQDAGNAATKTQQANPEFLLPAYDTQHAMNKVNFDENRGTKPKVKTEILKAQSTQSVQTFRTREGLLVKVYTCNILNLQKEVECIVNAANKELNHVGGLAKLIAKAAGETLNKEGKQHIAEHGKLNPGEVCKTTAGDLKFRCVIHAVGPRWIEYKPHTKEKVKQCQQHIFDAVHNSLQLAEGSAIKTMAFPTISSGTYGCPRDMCCVQYAKAVCDYSSLAENRLDEVHFVDVDESMVDMMHEYFSPMFKQGKIHVAYVMEKYVAVGAGYKDSLLTDVYEADKTYTDISKKKDTGVNENDTCIICMDTIKIRKTLACGHAFCQNCIDNAFSYKKACPTCGRVLGVVTGDQPEGDMKVIKNKNASCEGNKGCGRIEITYTFGDGRQKDNHPQPGNRYKGIRRTAYLPDNKQGNEILKMLEIAFDRKLIFTIGSSRTTGKEGVITWNDIHHKTDPRPYSQFGYPDPTYLERVTDELKAKGITPDDIQNSSRGKPHRH